MSRKTPRFGATAVRDAIARSQGYAISQQKCKLIEQGFGWVKTVGPMGARTQAGRPDVCPKHARLQPRAHAFPGTDPSKVALIGQRRLEMGAPGRKTRFRGAYLPDCKIKPCSPAVPLRAE